MMLKRTKARLAKDLFLGYRQQPTCRTIAPTVMLRQNAFGGHEPRNPLAEQFCKFAKQTVITGEQVKVLREMGINVEIKHG